MDDLINYEKSYPTHSQPEEKVIYVLFMIEKNRNNRQDGLNF